MKNHISTGVYEFAVLGYERSGLTANIKLQVMNAGGIVGETVKSIYLHSINKSLLCAFFRSIGLMNKSSKSFIMDWSKIAGCTGQCYINPGMQRLEFLAD